MSKLDELIKELCPSGVEYKEVQDICAISRGKVMSKDYISENAGKYPVYSSQTENDGVLGCISTYDYEGEYLTWTTDGANAGTVFYRVGRFNITNVCGLLKVKIEQIDTRYLYYKIIKDVKVPFKMSGRERIEDTPVHKALREALANCLIHADYHGLRGIVIRKEAGKLIFANPGYIRTGKKQMRLGGESDSRNKALMKMSNLINIGERAGSDVSNIFNVWADESWEEPIIEERFDPDRTVLTLSFVKK